MPWSTSTRKARLPADWPAIRRRILNRDQHECQIGYTVCIGIATEVDHVKAGDNHDDSNLQATCHPCHARKSAAEGHAAKPTRRREPERHPGLINRD